MESNKEQKDYIEFRKDTLVLFMVGFVFLAVVAAAVWDLYLKDTGVSNRAPTQQSPAKTSTTNLIQSKPSTTILEDKKTKQNPSDNSTTLRQQKPANTEKDLEYTQGPLNSDAVTTKDMSVLLGRPEDTSITLNIVSNNDVGLYVEYGPNPRNYPSKIETISVKANTPVEVKLTGLAANTRYYYQLKYKIQGSENYESNGGGTFQTARPKGSSFTFAIEADPHLDEQSDPQTYGQTLSNILAERPDFLIDLGDIFMSDKLPQKNYAEIEKRHTLLRNYFDVLGDSTPLFLVLGNHEGENGWENTGSQENIALWANKARKLYYPNPTTDTFYSGDTHQAYYSWTWGDALFVILDPYGNTMKKPGNDGWGWTLGKQQYEWFKTTLQKSDARYKFVFSHQLVGGDQQGRGGIEYANLYEWGGQNKDGSWGFDKQRPGWGKPIHRLMLENNVTIFFHGHDHFYAKQQLDGIVYQEVPQPSHPGGKLNTATEYGYTKGTILPASGFILVNVSRTEVRVDYVKTSLSMRQNMENADSYTLPLE
jgi:hypothetical protein